MREIKFRAWHIQNKEMVYFDNHKASSDPFQCSAMVRLMSGLDTSGHLMQYTGLKDFKEEDIYEGDILNSSPKEYPNDDGAPYVVVFSDGAFRIEYQPHEPHTILSRNQLSPCNDVIIGNIHEDQELLK